MSPRPVPVSAPPRVRERLHHAADGPVRIVHRGPHAVYVEVGGTCVGVVGSAAVGVPCAVRLATADLGALTTGSAATAGGVLHLDGTPLPVRRLLDVLVPRRRLVPAPRAHSTVPQRLVAAIGRGPGLTPEADDLLCGWLALHRCAGVETPALDLSVRESLGRTTLLSATLLECAVRGEVVPEFAAYVASLGTCLEPARAASLTRIGHTSGLAMLRGARLALDHLTQQGMQAA